MHRRVVMGVTSLALTAAFTFAGNSGCADDELVYVDRTEHNDKVWVTRREVGTLKNGEKHGCWVEIFDGRPTEIQYWRDGERHGPRYVPLKGDGRLILEGTYLEGLQHGRHRTFHSPDQLSDLRWFDRGITVGTSCSWNSDGFLEAIQEYEDGRLVSQDVNPLGACPTLYGAGKRHADPNDQDYRIPKSF